MTSLEFIRVPDELKQRKQWVLWTLNKNGKEPCQINGQLAKSTDPLHWATFNEAVAAYEEGQGWYSGIGYVFSKEDPYVGVDLDDCVTDGKLSDEAQKIVSELNSYTELSQSGNGLHIFVKASKPGTKCKNTKQDFEMYEHSRFFVVTGSHMPGTPETIEERQLEVNSLYVRMFGKSNETKPSMPSELIEFRDHDIINKALRSNIGAQFQALYAGDTSAHGDDDSSADLALCNYLVFYTRDMGQIDRIFRSSGLMRDKWEREDYRERTINKALADVTEQYTGRKKTATAAEDYINSLPQNNKFDESELDFLLDTPAEWEGVLEDDAYYGLAGDVVRLIEPHTEADPAALLINFLTIFGHLVGTEPHFVVSGGEHRMKLFVVLVGKTFRGKKGMSLEPIQRLMTAVDSTLPTRTASGLSSGEGVIYAVRDKVLQMVPVMEGKGKDKQPTGQYEEVVIDYGANDKRLLVIESEFGGVLNILRRDGNTLSAIIRNAWDGEGNIRTLTKNPMSATDSHISILGHITPEELRKLLTGTEIYNGFVNRFLWVYVEQSKSLPSGGEFHKINVEPIVERIQSAVAYADSQEFLGERVPIERDEEADELWNQIYEPIQQDAEGAIGAATSRVIPYLMRIASIYALLDKTHVVRVEHLRAALSLWKYCYKSVQFIFGDQNLQYDPTVSRILESLQDRPEGMSATDISNEVFQRNVQADEIRCALQKMLESSMITVESISSGKGRPKQIYRLNNSNDLVD